MTTKKFLANNKEVIKAISCFLYIPSLTCDPTIVKDLRRNLAKVSLRSLSGLPQTTCKTHTPTHWQHFHYVMKLRSFIACHNVEQGVNQLSNQNEKKKLCNAKDCNRFSLLYQLRRQIPTAVRAGKIQLCTRPTMQQPIPSCQISLQNKVTK